MPTESIIFEPTIDERDLQQETDKVNEELEDVGEDVPVNFDAEDLQMDALEPGAGGLNGEDGGGLGGAAGGGALAGLASKIPKPIAGVASSVALPVALVGGTGIAMLSAMQSASARLQTSADLLQTAKDNFFRAPGDVLDKFIVRPLAKEFLDFSLDFDEQFRDIFDDGGGLIPGPEQAAERIRGTEDLIDEFPLEAIPGGQIGEEILDGVSGALSGGLEAFANDEIQLTDFTIPPISVPVGKFELPDIDIAESLFTLPQLKLAKSLVTLPSLSLSPDKISLPEVSFPGGNISLPDIEVPEPKFQLPDVEVPEFMFELPNIDVPEFMFEIPDIDIPEPNFKLPDINIPENVFELPKINIPEAKFKLPDINLGPLSGGGNGNAQTQSNLSPQRGGIGAGTQATNDVGGAITQTAADRQRAQSVDMSGLESRLDRVNRNLEALRRAFDVTLEVDEEAIGRTVKNAEANRIGDMDPSA